MQHEWGTGVSASPQTMLFTANMKKTSLCTRHLQPLVLGEAAEMLERGKGLFLGKGATTERPSHPLKAGVVEITRPRLLCAGAGMNRTT